MESASIEIIGIVCDLLEKLSNERSISAKQRVAICDIYNLYRTPIKSDILNVLIPIIHRLRQRIRNGDATYFASDKFVVGVTDAVILRCDEIIEMGRMTETMKHRVINAIGPLIDTIKTLASNYVETALSKRGSFEAADNGAETRSSDRDALDGGEMFVFVIERMSTILDLMPMAQPSAR